MDLASTHQQMPSRNKEKFHKDSSHLWRVHGFGTPTTTSAAGDITFDVLLTRGSTGGIGLGFRGHAATTGPFPVDMLVPGSPAEHCQRIRPGDLIIAVNNVSAQSLSVDQVRELIVGNAGQH